MLELPLEPEELPEPIELEPVELPPEFIEPLLEEPLVPDEPVDELEPDGVVAVLPAVPLVPFDEEPVVLEPVVLEPLVLGRVVAPVEPVVPAAWLTV